MSDKICPVCGKPFINKSGHAQKYCSEACRRKANRNIKDIEKHTNSLRDVRLQVANHYKYQCAICGWQLPDNYSKDGKFQYTRGCEIHHIIPVCEGGENTAKNLILLCPNCHKLANLGFISKDELYEYVKATLQPDEIELFFEQEGEAK